MADYWTYLQLKTKVKNDCDLQSETFVSETELLGYFNEGIDDIEKSVHRLNEDYMLSSVTVPLVSGTASYDMPADIYAMKIRGIIYTKSTDVYPIKRLRDWKKLENYEIAKTTQQNGVRYAYLVRNAVAGLPKITITPTPNETGASIQVWYLRNSNKLINDTSICDVPESVNYLIQFVKNKVYEKEHNPAITKAIGDLQIERENMLLALAEKTPDNDTELEPDFSLYNEMV